MIEIERVKDRAEGNLRAHDVLRKIVDGQTLLALSGGTSPDYRKMIVEAADILPGAACLIDERFTSILKENTNEEKIRNDGLVDYFIKTNINFYPILGGKGFVETAKDYDQLIYELFIKYHKKVGVMGVGGDLHTAGIFPNSVATQSDNFVEAETVNDGFSQRITLTLKALSEFQYFVILIFGEEKKEALLKMLDEGENDVQKYPAIFYRKSFAKCWLITDVDI